MKSTAILALAAALSCSLVAADATAQSSDSPLRGQYAFTESAQCLNSPGGFNPSLQPNDPSQSTLSSATFAGVDTFDGRGGLTVDETFPVIITPASAQNTTWVPLAESQSGTGSGSYKFEADGSVTITVGLAVTILSGREAGVTYSIDQLVQSGQLSLDNKTLVLSITKPVVSTLTASNGFVSQFVCNGSGTAVKVGP